MPWKNKQLPEFGVLRGLKVVHSTVSIAGPFGVQLLADHGADVIWIENAKAPDLARFTHSYAVESDRRNQRGIALNIPSPEGREIFLKLIEDADIFVEASKGGQYVKWGLSDDVLWSVNPKLVIIHISGFGQTGLPQYISRASYDQVIQAFSGYMYMNRNPVTAPYAVGPCAADFFTGVYVAFSAMAALYRVRETGKGESVDLAQAEVMLRTQHRQSDGLSGNTTIVAGYPSPTAGIGSYECADGQFISCNLVGPSVFQKTCEFLGLDYGGPDIPEGTQMGRMNTKIGQIVHSALQKYFMSKTAAEAEAEMQALNLSVNKVNTFEDVANDPQMQARGAIVEYPNAKGDPVRCAGPVPLFTNNPGKVWRYAPAYGMDNEEVLGELGYSSDYINELYEKGIINKDREMKLTFPY